MTRKPNQHLSRRQLLGALAFTAPLWGGCMSPWLADVPDERKQREDNIRAALTSENRPKLLNEIAFHREMTLALFENVGLVTGLLDTGGAVKPSSPRSRLLAMMKTENTADPNTTLDDKSTTMVVASVTVAPAARKGTTLDVLVQRSAHADASSLENGWLMPTPLVAMSHLGGEIRTSFKTATAAGRIVTVAQATGSEDPHDQLRGSIIGGATYSKQRELGIVIQSDYADALTMKAILPAIKARFTVFDGSAHIGAATPTKDNYIKLALPKKYELDPYHFINVVLNIGFNETAEERAERISLLAHQILNPDTAQQACWQLEAIGEETLPILSGALASEDPKVRFFAAHSMAYMDDRSAIEPLKHLCSQEPAFRAMALNALTVAEHFEAEAALRELLHNSDAETRYGAVRALRLRDRRDPQVRATQIAETGQLLEIPSEGPPLVAVSLSKVPEIVFFGCDPIVTIPEFVFVNKHLMIRAEPDGRLMISNFLPGQPDQVVTKPNDLRSILTGIAEVGGTYGDWVSFLRESSKNALFIEPIALDPVAKSGRVYERERDNELEPGEKRLDSTIVHETSDDDEKSKRENSTDSKRSLNPFTWWSK